jgi:tripartite-type tricarboxylate transporter receptor subunit TctC
VKDVRDLVKLAKKRPGDLNFSSAGHGSGPHLSLERFKLATGVNVVHVPYKSGAEGVVAVITGSGAAMFEAPPVVMPHIGAGKLRALAVASLKRLGAMPRVAMATESGLPGFETGTWMGIVAPAKTRGDILARLNSEIGRAVGSPDLLEKFNAGIVATANSSEEFQRFIKTESEWWGEVIRRSGARIE